MKKLLSSLVAATIVGAFSLPVMAATSGKTAPAMPATPAATESHAASAVAEKPADAPKTQQGAVQTSRVAWRSVLLRRLRTGCVWTHRPVQWAQARAGTRSQHFFRITELVRLT